MARKPLYLQDRVQFVRGPLLEDPGKPVAYIHNLPLTASEALAFSAYSAGVASTIQREIIQTWKVKMSLMHGTWVLDETGFD